MGNTVHPKPLHLFERFFMQKISIQTAYVKGQKLKSKFPAAGAEFILKSIKPLLIGEKLVAVFNSKFDLDIADFNESDVLSPNNRNMYNWEKAFIFEIGKNLLSVDFSAYYCYKIGLNSHDASSCVDIQNLTIKEISKYKDAYMNISFLYNDILGCKIQNIYPILSEDNVYLSAVVLDLDNGYSVVIRKDIDNPRMEVLPSKFITDKNWSVDE